MVADVVQLAALLCPPSTVSLASFGALLAHLPLASLQAPPSPSPSPCSLAAAKGTSTHHLALYLQLLHAVQCALKANFGAAHKFNEVLPLQASLFGYFGYVVPGLD